MRCPRLGGAVSFFYCRTCGDDRLPCRLIADCWWERFPIVEFLEAHLTADQLARFQQRYTQPPPKIVSLVDLIAQTRQRSQH